MTVQNISIVPQTINITAYAGDTFGPLTLTPKTAGFVNGRVFTAHVRSSRTSDTVDATFTVVPGATEDDPVSLSLSSAATRALVGNKQKYQGVWDCQIAPPGGGDPSQTVAQGKVVILQDVTRTDG